MLGHLLQWLHVPGLIKPFEYHDFESDQDIKIKTSPRYTILSIGNKEFFFVRETGELDGAGAMSLDDETRLNYLRAERTQRSRSPHAPVAPSGQK